MAGKPEPAAPRPTFALGRVAKDGRLDFDLVVKFWEALTGRPLTAEEMEAARRSWRARFPDDPAVREPPQS
jgi:hypothetical protein